MDVDKLIQRADRIFEGSVLVLGWIFVLYDVMIAFLSCVATLILGISEKQKVRRKNLTFLGSNLLTNFDKCDIVLLKRTQKAVSGQFVVAPAEDGMTVLSARCKTMLALTPKTKDAQGFFSRKDSLSVLNGV